MFNCMKHFLETVREHLVVSVLVILLVVEAGTLFWGGALGSAWLQERGQREEDTASYTETHRLSEIDGPRIDDGAVMTIVSSEGILPGELWVFLLLAYGALLVFNFSYTFEKVVRPQWGWEVIYTLFVLWGWSVMDTERLYLWFPFMILKVGLIVFALYVSLLEKRGDLVQQKLFEE